MAERLRNPRQDPFVLRRRLKTQGKLVIPADQFNFLWVIEFPLLGFDREQNRWYSSHHPFTAPVAEDIPLLKTDPKKVRGQHYDVVVNGVELGGGSIRIHQPDVQKTIFEELLQFRRTKRSCVSVTCWTRSNTARRRTAASRWASTA
jgi:aspartyl-tRNA synthetase